MNNLSEQNYHQEDEIDLRQLFKSLAERKWFIFGFTSFVTILAMAYVLSISPTYKANISFLSPSASSVIELNKTKLISETSETIYRQFLNKLMSGQFQRKVFDENDYLSKLNFKDKAIQNLENIFAEFSQSINLETNKIQKNIEKPNYEKPINISIKGGDAQVVSSFLNNLANAANAETVDEFLTIIQQKIDIRLEEILNQKNLLLLHTKQDRLAKIVRIRIEDEQKIKELNDQINRLRIKAKQERINKIQILMDAAKIANTLGIKENNFKKIGNKKANDSILTVSVGNNQKLPKWYLYGERALSEEIKILKNRVNDDYYTPDIVNLQSKLRAIKSNQTLKTLIARKNDSPFIAEINKLNIETIKLKSFKISSTGINAMQINQYAYPPEVPIKPKKNLVVTVVFITGFILSILLVFMMNAFRSE